MVMRVIELRSDDWVLGSVVIDSYKISGIRSGDDECRGGCMWL